MGPASLGTAEPESLRPFVSKRGGRPKIVHLSRLEPTRNRDGSGLPTANRSVHGLRPVLGQEMRRLGKTASPQNNGVGGRSAAARDRPDCGLIGQSDGAGDLIAAQHAGECQRCEVLRAIGSQRDAPERGVDHRLAADAHVRRDVQCDVDGAAGRPSTSFAAMAPPAAAPPTTPSVVADKPPPVPPLPAAARQRPTSRSRPPWIPRPPSAHWFAPSLPRSSAPETSRTRSAAKCRHQLA